MIYLNKLLPIFASPLGLISFLIILGILTKRTVYIVTALLLLWLTSLPIVSNSLMGILERNYEVQTLDNLEEHDTVVVLSGMVRTIKNNDEIHYEFTEAVDRILAGVRLVKSGKANRMILTRGQLPWSLGDPEGEFLSEFVNMNGIDAGKITLTRVVQNTDDEAKAIAELITSNEKLILITSAFHMPRARMVFENQNIFVTEFAVDFRNRWSKLDILDFLPQAKAFKDSSLFIREMIGRAYYSLKY
jgi:uncharacterized SAM-binding protein YcdF (DUF218 family)